MKELMYKKIGQEIGILVQEKNRAYGDSFGQACKILEVLYPEGIKPEQYRDALERYLWLCYAGHSQR